MQCSSLLVPPAVSDGVHMNRAETRCQSISDVQETRYLQTQTATEHLVPVLHFPFRFLKGGRLWPEETRVIFKFFPH